MQDKDNKKLRIIDESLDENPFISLIRKAKTGAEILEAADNATPYIWYAEGLIENKGLHSVFARAKRGKSMVVALLADAISKGRDWSPYTRNNYGKPVKTLYIETELEEVEWKQRHGRNFVENLAMTVLYKSDIATHPQQISESPEALVNLLRGAVDEGYRLIILDSISYASINISDVKQAQRYKLALNKFAGELLAKKIDVSLIFVAHMTKVTTNKKGQISFELMQGASDWSQLYRTMIGIGKREDVGQEGDGIYLKSETRSGKPERLGYRCFPILRSQDENGHVVLDVEEPRFEDELINPVEIVDTSKKDVIRVTLLALLEQSKLYERGVQDKVAMLTGTNQPNISRAKKLQEETYLEVKGNCENAESWINYWDSIQKYLAAGGEIPFELKQYVDSQREDSIPF